MKTLEDFKLADIAGYITDKITEEKGVSKSLARKLLINAMTYNVVIAEIMDQIDYLMEE